MNALRIAWITRSFLDYRVPVFSELDRQCGGGLHLFYSADYVPDLVQKRVRELLGARATGLRGEWRLGGEDRDHMANCNFSLRMQRGLGACVRRCAPDVMVGDGFFKWTFHALLERMRHGTPLLIAYERTPHTERKAQRIRTLYRRFVVRRTDAMACSGSLCADYVKALGMPRERVTTGQMAADTPFFSDAARALNPSALSAFLCRHRVEGTLYLHVGRIMPLKGCRELIEAWKCVSALPGARTLMFVGEGPLESELKAYCAEHRIDSVRFAGAVPYADLPLVYASADVLVSATMEDNWSLVVPEAMACGLPVLCSRYNGCWPELVQEGVNGWVFDPRKDDAFAAALKRTTETETSLKAMGQQSMRIVEAFSPERAAAAILTACQIATERHRKRHA